MENNISVDFEDLARQNGDRVDISTKDCIFWGFDHENCGGCPSELGCAKAVAMFGVIVGASLYEPRSYAEFEARREAIHKKQVKILAAKKVKQIHAIF